VLEETRVGIHVSWSVLGSGLGVNVRVSVRVSVRITVRYRHVVVQPLSCLGVYWRVAWMAGCCDVVTWML